MKKFLTVIAGFFILAASFYSFKMADLYFRQEAHVYHPDKEWSQTPDSEGLAYEDITLITSDGVKISAWFVPCDNAKGTVLFLHGNARNISADMDALKMFHQFNYRVLTVDYRGYGKSEGTPSEEGTYRDAQAGWDWITAKKQESPDRIVICGRSLGAAIAADLALKNRPRGLILEAAFTTLADAGQDLYPYFPVKLLSKYRYDTLGKLPNIHCPILIVHSRSDELIPFHHAQRLYEGIPGKKAMIELGGQHKGGYVPTLDKYEAGVKLFLESL